MIPVTEIYGRKASNGELNTITVVAMTIFHILAVAAFFFIDWGAIAMMVFLWWVAGSLGHRHGLSPPADASRLQDAEVG